MDAGILSIGNLDLRRKVGYRPGKKIYHPSVAFLHQECRQNRTYEDFKLIRKAFQYALCKDTHRKGWRLFGSCFLILTDNGSEFKRIGEIEFTVTGERRTRVYYCDPQASWQKPHIEKNNQYIRYVLPRVLIHIRRKTWYF